MPGILLCLDDAGWGRSDEEADSRFLDQLHSSFGGAASAGAAPPNAHPSYLKPKRDSASTFGVAHYAGVVLYRVHGFSRKNRDAISTDLADLVRESGSAWVQANSKHVLGHASGAGGAARLKHPSVGEKFRNQLSELMGVVDTAGGWYVRCVRSNDGKTPWSLDQDLCADQLRCAGMMETVRIRSERFVYREPHEEFVKRYVALGFGPWAAVGGAGQAGTRGWEREDAAKLCAALCAAAGLDGGAWQCGMTKLFMRPPLQVRGRLTRIRQPRPN